MDDKIISQLENALLSIINDVVNTATSYTISSEQLEVLEVL